MHSGEELSKRTGSMSLKRLREEGIHPLAVDSFLAKLGTSEALEPCSSLQDLVSHFELAKISLAEAQFDPQELRRFNCHLLGMLPFETVESDLKAAGLAISREFWVAIRKNIDSLQDVTRWHDICFGTVSLPEIVQAEDPAFLTACLCCLENAPETFADSGSWDTFSKELSQATGRRGRDLFHPFRLLCTGQETGPELRVLASFMGRERIIERLKSATPL
jgi:glutamyl-tRNA synthetase